MSYKSSKFGENINIKRERVICRSGYVWADFKVGVPGVVFVSGLSFLPAPGSCACIGRLHNCVSANGL